jgi:hypothetical protein
VRRALAVVVLAGLAALAPAARAQQLQVQPRRDELFKMIDAYIVSNLQESLALSDEQFVKILPLVKKLQADRRAFTQSRAQTLNELKRLMESGSATDASVAELMKSLRASEAQEPEALRRDRDALDAVLSPVQQAKLRLLENRVEQRLREIVTRARPDAASRPFRRATPTDPAP